MAAKKKTASQLQTSGDLGDSSASATFGVVLDVNGHEVIIMASDISNAAENGIDFTLPEPMDIGSITDLMKFLQGLGLSQFPTLPSPFDSIVTVVNNADFTVVKLHVKIPGTATTDKTKYYTLNVKADLQTNDQTKVGPLTVKGFVGGVTNEGT